jgi:hypothetical protein
MTMNCVRKPEGQREINEGFQNFKKGVQKESPTDRQTHGATNSEYENTTLIYSSRTA